MKDVWMDVQTDKRKINKKKIVSIILITVVIVFSIVVIGLYVSNEQAREWIDKNIFRKEVLQDNVTTIDLKEDQNANIYAFNRYIGILNKTKFSIYGNTGNEEQTLEIQISSPILILQIDF